MTPAAQVIGLFGGLASIAKALGHRHRTTAQGWMERGVIPVRQQAAVLAAAKARGLNLDPAVFIPSGPLSEPNGEDEGA